MPTDLQLIKESFIEVGQDFRSRPFNFIKESQVKYFFYNALARRFDAQIPLELDSGIEIFPLYQDKYHIHRVQSELSVTGARAYKCDVGILEERTQYAYSQSNKMLGCLKPPYHSVFEIKKAYGTRTRRFSENAKSTALEDVKKLVELNEHYRYGFIVLLDFCQGRMADAIRIRCEIEKNKKLGFYYSGLDEGEEIIHLPTQ